MLEELKFFTSVVVSISTLVFTVPISLSAGIAVAQKIELIECVAPQNQTEIQK